MSQTGQPGAPEPGGMPPAPPPQAPPPPSWQSTPQPPMPPAGGPPAAPSPQMQQVNMLASQLMDRTPVAGPAGYYYADVPNRAIAFIIDYIIFFIVLAIIGAITLAIFGSNLGFGITLQTTTSVLVQQVLTYGIIGAYFVYTWTALRGTVGMRLLGMQIGHESDGRTIDMNQALTRYALLFGPGFVAGLVSSFALGLGLIASLVSFIWFIALVVTTAQSPTKQGLHDRYAHTMVVKAARAVG